MPPSLTAIPLEEWIDPALAHREVVGRDEHGFWLDAGPEASAGWSWLGKGVPETDASRVRSTRVDRGADSLANAKGGPFRGGWVGWVDYETGARSAGAPVARSAAARETWLRVEEFLAFDHAERRVWAWSDSPAAARALAARTAAASTRATSPARLPEMRAVVARARISAAEYVALIDECRSRIRDGDAYLLCLTTSFDVDGAFDPRHVHERLRASSPSHHGALIRAGDSSLVSASPERFLEIAGGVVRTRPIKGTRPRDPDPDADSALVAELRADPKERAENVMIVDLMRNDLSRVCAPATVTVDALLDVETYPTVHQLVSAVSGELARGRTLGDVLRATFPAGSMTGAPKASAMGILAHLERAPRGVYSGCFGWVGHDGGADLAMVIRSVLVGRESASVGAGGGITWHSQAAQEVREVGWKARAPLAALGASLPEGW